MQNETHDTHELVTYAKRSNEFLQRVLTPIIAAGVISVTGGAVTAYIQIRELSSAVTSLQKQHERSYTDLQDVSQKVHKMYYGGKWDTSQK